MKSNVWLYACVCLAGCASEAAPTLSETGPIVSWDEFRANPPVTWQAFRGSVAREPLAPHRFIVDGDITLSDENQLWNHYQAWLAQEYAATVPGGEALTVRNVLGADIIWHYPQNYGLTYCISNQFNTRKSTVIDAMDRATRSWSDKISVGFSYRSDQDATCDSANTNVLFNVNPTIADFFAASFFPDSARSDRQLLITDSAFTTTDGGRDFEGILRHETGHILGFRHEHIILNNCTGESAADSRQVTSYDVNSVMHYPQCRPSGSGGYRQTTLDYLGAAKLYGSYAWDPWSSVSQGHAATGSTVTAVPIGNGRFALFLADPNGGVYTASGSAQTGWTGWSSVSGGHAATGSTVTAVPVGDGRIELFVGDPGGGVYTTVGNSQLGWSSWSSVSQGHVATGGTISALPIGGGQFAVFLADPNGGVYTASGSATGGWTGWSSVSQGHAATRSTVTAVPVGDGRIELFLGDPNGGVYTAIGNSQLGWSPWSSVSQGHVATGGTVSALPTGGGQFAVFLADPNGGVYTASGSATSGWTGWSSVSQGHAATGSTVIAVSTGNGRIALYLGDPNGGVYTASGNAASGWTGWSSVSQGHVATGGTVSAAPIGDGRIALFLADPGGGVYTTSGVSERVF